MLDRLTRDALLLTHIGSLLCPFRYDPLHIILSMTDNIENDSAYANMPLGEPSLQQHLANAKHSSEIAALQHALQVSREETATRKSKHDESKKAARRQIDEVVRTYQSKLHTSESELQAAQERMRTLEKAKMTSAKELEGNLAQTMSGTHRERAQQWRVECELTILSPCSFSQLPLLRDSAASDYYRATAY